MKYLYCTETRIDNPAKEKRWKERKDTGSKGVFMQYMECTLPL